MRQFAKLSAFLIILLTATATADEPSLDIRSMIQPVPEHAKLQHDDWYTWGGSVLQGEDDKFHMFYCRWPKSYPFSEGWLQDAEICYAVAGSPAGPFKHVRTILQGRKHDGKPFAWDARSVYNPTVKHFDGKYYLYYTGCVDPETDAKRADRSRLVTHQQIGVVIADSLADLAAGKYERSEKSILSPRTRLGYGLAEDDEFGDPANINPANIVVVNPSVDRRPDGKYIMIFKGWKNTKGFSPVHGVAISDTSTGPFEVQDTKVFAVNKNGRLAMAEDPFIWYHKSHQRFYGIVKDFHGGITGSGKSLALFESDNGIDWRPSEHLLASDLTIEWTNGTTEKAYRLERPQLLLDSTGRPTALYAACQLKPAHSFNIHIPLAKSDSDKTAQPATDMIHEAKQLQDLRFGMFICWSFSTFSGYEWTPGVEDINFFNPTGFDPDQWCEVAKSAGMNYILFLTKHHDGFCLWDTKTTDRKVSNTIALQGVDVLAEVKKACDKHGLKLALYFSEGDWSWSGRKDIHTSAARPETKKAQLRELLTNYGPIEYIWFDHAVGTGGLSHAETSRFVKSLQPRCFVGYNHGKQDGADIRLGERGKPAPLHEATAESIGSSARAEYMKGHTGFLLAEFTYPILEGQGRQNLRGAQWFYSLPENDNYAASPEKIYRDWLGAEKFGNIFSLDVGPDRSGKLREIDVRTLRKVGQYIRGEIELPPEPLDITAASASSEWNDEHSAEKATDANPQTRWGAAPDSRSAWLALELPNPATVSRVVIDEGNWNRIRKFAIEARKDNQWTEIATGTRIGPEKEITFHPVKTDKLRLRIDSATEVPTILEFSIY
ncbi:Alpha-L-fucosidase [Anaerohalosphaera lusitana]|uniref:alpha-L-fucosidase n=1 Tax=Anaerohalosphaera lusitana TaxID=1936003 RepID=A0A1U9NHL0_9BACT|nr:alpha-L-fucosidase [Anaerohalosphaera lusitana]AQT67234.1 Alpha-L-fucosidase [Anaerohalosphaera lusitana]